MAETHFYGSPVSRLRKLQIELDYMRNSQLDMMCLGPPFPAGPRRKWFRTGPKLALVTNGTHTGFIRVPDVNVTLSLKLPDGGLSWLDELVTVRITDAH